MALQVEYLAGLILLLVVILTSPLAPLPPTFDLFELLLANLLCPQAPLPPPPIVLPLFPFVPK